MTLFKISLLHRLKVRHTRYSIIIPIIWRVADTSKYSQDFKRNTVLMQVNLSHQTCHINAEKQRVMKVKTLFLKELKETFK